MEAEPFAIVGRVVKTHGLNGEVSVAPAAGTSLAALVGLDVWFTPPSATVRSSRITAVRPGPKGPLLSLQGVGDATTARLLCGSEIMVRTPDIPDGAFTVPEDEPDVAGYVMTDEDHGLIGTVVDTIVTGANDVWVVSGPFGEVLVPVIDDVVLAVDDSAQTISVALLDGLLPEKAGNA